MLTMLYHENPIMSALRAFVFLDTLDFYHNFSATRLQLLALLSFGFPYFYSVNNCQFGIPHPYSPA